MGSLFLAWPWVYIITTVPSLHFTQSDLLKQMESRSSLLKAPLSCHGGWGEAHSVTWSMRPTCLTKTSSCSLSFLNSHLCSPLTVQDTILPAGLGQAVSWALSPHTLTTMYTKYFPKYGVPNTVLGDE
jgi:hypothetical protein